MSSGESDDDSSEPVTVENIQRIEGGYFDHMQSLREQVPVAEYMLEPATNRWGVIFMAGIAVAIAILYPLTMYYQYTYLVTLLYMILFIVFGYIFYERVMKPNEGTETWSD